MPLPVISMSIKPIDKNTTDNFSKGTFSLHHHLVLLRRRAGNVATVRRYKSVY